MLQTRRNANTTQSFFSTLEVIYYVTVRSVRGGNTNAVIGIMLNIVQSLVMIAMFLAMYLLIGLKSSPIRGDFLLYVMSGVFLFRTHIQAVSSTQGAANSLGSMMQHAPMNTIISITSAALASLYKQVFAIIVILGIYHLAFTPITIDNPIGAMGMLILAWFSGLGVGLIFAALNPWFTKFTTVASNLYRRANMIASGKMFLVNTLPSNMIALFSWNPLFHIIDQNKGFVFLHYTPRVTSIDYALQVSIVLIFIGMMGEYYTRQYVSASWSAGK